jgi:hypothetical protein
LRKLRSRRGVTSARARLASKVFKAELQLAILEPFSTPAKLVAL